MPGAGGSGWAGAAWQQDLTANPIEFITRYTGDWTLRFLVFTLAITPLRKLLGLPDLIHFRRMIGLFAFFYGALHFITYIWLDKFFDFAGDAARTWPSGRSSRRASRLSC